MSRYNTIRKVEMIVGHSRNAAALAVGTFSSIHHYVISVFARFLEPIGVCCDRVLCSHTPPDVCENRKRET